MFRLALAGARASLNMTRDWGFREPMAAAEPIPRLTTPVRANRREPGDPGRRRSGWHVQRDAFPFCIGTQPRAAVSHESVKVLQRSRGRLRSTIFVKR
jgi:hypothetical protein